MRAARPPATPVLEVGCGDGLLLDLLAGHGFDDRLGIDPGRAATSTERPDIIGGWFPQDLDAAVPGKRYGLIVLRHVLEHIETPVPFVAALAERLAPDGELWIEVPDLDATAERELWSNLYQLHCNYFDHATLDALAGRAGLRCVSGEIVDVFGGSLLRRYRTARPSRRPPRPTAAASPRASARSATASPGSPTPCRPARWDTARRSGPR